MRRRNRVTVKCAHCGRKFERRRHLVAKAKRHYCRRECMDSSLRSGGAAHQDTHSGRMHGCEGIARSFSMAIGRLTKIISRQSKMEGMPTKKIKRNIDGYRRKWFDNW